jgi:putative ABC transport system permease protein
MAMSARERQAEYATLKVLGFGPGFLAALIVGESLFLSLAGAAGGIALLFPLSRAIAASLGTMFPVFAIAPATLAMQLGAALVVGLVAGLVPAVRAARMRILDGLRSIG